MYKCSCGKTYTQEQMSKVDKKMLNQVGCGKCKQIGNLHIDYNGFKLTVFKLINGTSVSYIKPRLEYLAKDFDVPYETVLQDFNKYSYGLYENVL